MLVQSSTWNIRSLNTFSSENCSSIIPKQKPEKRKALRNKISKILGGISKNEKNGGTEGKWTCKNETEAETNGHLIRFRVVEASVNGSNSICNPPEVPDPTVLSSFPSTRSNRKGMTQRKNRRKDSSPSVKRANNDGKETVFGLSTPTCIDIQIGRMITRKYIPRLQMISETSPEIL